MWRKWSEGSLQTAIISSFTLMVAVVLVAVMTGLAAKSNQMARENAVLQARQTVTQANAALGGLITDALNTVALVKSIAQDQKDIADASLSEAMLLLKRQNRDISSLAVYSANGDVLAAATPGRRQSSRDIREAAWFRRALLTRPSTVSISTPHLKDSFSGQYVWVTTLSTQVVYKRGGRDETGVLSMDLRFGAISELLSQFKLGESGYVYLLDADSELIYHDQLPLIRLGIRQENVGLVAENVFGEFNDALNGRERFVVVQTVDFTGWRLVGVSYMDEVMDDSDRMFRSILMFLAAGILMALSVAIIIGRRIARPMDRLTQIVRSVEGGDLDVDIPQQGFLEIANLASAFHLMLGRIKLLMHQIVLEQEQKRLYELDALQAQINPHFLYNTLDSIVWMQERGQNREAIQMVTALARLFRISISKGRSIITVVEEIEHVRNYLIIQSIRFKNRFTYAINAQPEALSLHTVKLVLQPIVENSIVHGLAHYATGEGHIQIDVSVEENTLVMRVRDNGLGMKRELAEGLLTRHSGSGGIGVTNVNERIRLTYGPDYGLEIESELDEGMLVTIRQPGIPKGDVP